MWIDFTAEDRSFRLSFDLLLPPTPSPPAPAASGEFVERTVILHKPEPGQPMIMGYELVGEESTVAHWDKPGGPGSTRVLYGRFHVGSVGIGVSLSDEHPTPAREAAMLRLIQTATWSPAAKPPDAPDAGAVGANDLFRPSRGVIYSTLSVSMKNGIVTRSGYQVKATGTCDGDCAMGPETVLSLVGDQAQGDPVLGGLSSCFSAQKPMNATISLTIAVSERGAVLRAAIVDASGHPGVANCLLRAFRGARLPPGSDPKAKYTFTFEARTMDG